MVNITKKQLKQMMQGTLNDCWNYHGKRIKETDKHITRQDLERYLQTVNLDEWEDVGYFVGYSACLNDMLREATDSETYEERKIQQGELEAKIRK